MFTHSSSGPSEWPWLWREVRPFWGYQAAQLLCILVYTTLMAGVPLLMKWVIDDVLPNRSWEGLAIASGLMCVLYAARVILAALGTVINGIGVQRMIYALRTRLLARLQTASPTFYERNSVGDLMQRLERDVTVVGELGTAIMPSLVRMVVKIVVTMIVMIVLDWHLACIVVALIPIFAYVRQRYRDILRRSAEDVREIAGRLSGLLNEVLTGAIQLQLLGAERRFLRRFQHLNLVSMRRSVTQRKNEEIFKGLEMCAIGLGTSLVIGYGGIRVMTGALTAGGLVAFYGYIGNIFEPLEMAVELYARVQRVRASIRRLMLIEQEETGMRDVPEAVTLSQPPRALTYRDVSFSYTPESPTLRGISFDARAGERIAIVGGSGSGKSSLLKLIPRLYDASEGRIELAGQDVRHVQLRSLRHAISFVPQDPVLFRGTVRDNVRHGCPAATSDEIAHAAWIACFAEVVDRLPKGWDTELGSLGAGLSGGERQRLAITRALLQGRSVLILDEATSALDLPTENRVFERLTPAYAHGIVFVVSHRPSASRWANRVLFMTRGALSEGPIDEGIHHVGAIT